MNVTLFIAVKNEYTEHLIDTLTPYIYEGITSIYKEAVKLAEQTGREQNTLLIFQKLLQSINGWSQIKIDKETCRIKQLSNTSEYLDDLIKAVVKTNIILLTYSYTVSNVIAQTFYNTFQTSTFIHRCYTECGKDFHNYPYLFFHDIDPMDYKRNQIIIEQHIQSGIERAIRKVLPISTILKEYLVNSINIINEPDRQLPALGFGYCNDPVQTRHQMQPQPHSFNQMQQIGKVMHPSPIAIDDPQEMYGNKLSEHKTDNKTDNKLENEVLQIIKSESIKPDKQKIRTIMEIDKIINSASQNANSPSKKQSVAVENFQKNFSENKIRPFILEEFNFDNGNLRDSDRKLLNLKLDESNQSNSKNSGNSSKKSVSGTVMSCRLMPSKNSYKMNSETSEKIDPSNVNFIEEYGTFSAVQKKKS